jgi:hypothetical protein
MMTLPSLLDLVIVCGGIQLGLDEAGRVSIIRPIKRVSCRFFNFNWVKFTTKKLKKDIFDFFDAFSIMPEVYRQTTRRGNLLEYFYKLL